ncbi:GNAT family N-acetyltransferase [Shimia abyssi]|uniref:Acetyltransferase (GNAT) family protein n=1 Tax=Shimia abyssi TaxID=1662395 RepID=A0A2P8FGQ4_9RHOB|nr:GNAT family N-acetyltransferase [Shimia abyssi]PSL20901.1 acetyltransferase (GNAT) family protein [Shimia abyssi]
MSGMEAVALIREARRFRPYSEALYPALSVDPFYHALEVRAPAGQDSRAAMLAYYDYSALEAERFGVLCTPPSGAYGASIWAKPMSVTDADAKSQSKAAVLRAAMGAECLRCYQEINENMTVTTTPVAKPEDWYLSILGVSPEFQGQGLGAGLILPVLEQADAAGVATYLETFTPRNMPFYTRLGFAEHGPFHEPVTGCDYWVMRRPAE